jgi:hypothetical protein
MCVPIGVPIGVRIRVPIGVRIRVPISVRIRVCPCVKGFISPVTSQIITHFLNTIDKQHCIIAVIVFFLLFSYLSKRKKKGD